MIIRVNPQDHEPIYSQIEKGVKLAILRGVWRPGEQIPSRREMSEELQINPNTIAVAYKNLERDGVVEVRRGMGVFVSAQALELARNFLRERLSEQVGKVIAEAREAELPDEDIRSLVEGFLDRAIAKEGDKS